jgi:serine/threonine-protein kinase
MTVGAWFGAWVATLALAARWDPSVAAQWSTVRSPIYHLGSWAIIAAVAAGSVHFGRQIATLQRELRVARRLSGYRLQARIGAGGMNEVWLARDEHAKRDVALKILHRDPSPDEARRFQREAEALQSLDSEHTVRVFEVGASDDGVMFIAMEHLDGCDLDRLVSERGALQSRLTESCVKRANSS